MAALAGASELGGGILTAAGIADPIGPVTVATTMAVAVHRQGGPMAATGGHELPLAYGALGVALAATGPGTLRIGPAAPKSLARAAIAVGGALAAVSIGRLVAASTHQARAAAAEAAATEPEATEPEVTEPEVTEPDVAAEEQVPVEA